ncbi:MAG: ribosomal protein L7/L12 [Gemmataceae bacterium]
MSEEAAFVEALTKDTLDDVTRMVYADWLEERGDPRAAFLRAEAALTELSDGDGAWFDAAAAVPRDGIHAAWAAAVGPRWELWLRRYVPVRKIHAIKVIRELTGCGLAEAKHLSEDPPPVRLQGGYSSIDALCAARFLSEACDLPAAEAVELRRAAGPPFTGYVGPVRPPAPPAPVPPLSVWLLGYPPRHKIGLIRMVRELTGLGLAATKAFVERPLPVCLAGSLGGEEADDLQRRFAPWATVEVRTTWVTPAGTAGPGPTS